MKHLKEICEELKKIQQNQGGAKSRRLKLGLEMS